MGILVSILIYALILGVIYWIITLLPLPPVVRQVVLVIIVVIALIMLIQLLGGLSLGVHHTNSLL